MTLSFATFFVCPWALMTAPDRSAPMPQAARKHICLLE